LAQRVIQVVDANGRLVHGAVELARHERQWRFVPDLPWSSGKYEIVIEQTLEDLAGNNIGKSFEVDLFEKVDRQIVRSAARLPFQVR
jgi:hypothetical protein